MTDKRVNLEGECLQIRTHGGVAIKCLWIIMIRMVKTF